MFVSRTYIFLLTACVVIHAIFGASSFVFILGNSWLSNGISPLHFLVILTVSSFIYYKRCVMIDIYDHVYNLEKDPEIKKKIPDYAKDNYPRNLIRKMIGTKAGIDMTPYRSDIIQKDIGEPAKHDGVILKKYYSQKFQYSIINIVLYTLISNQLVRAGYLSYNINYIFILYWIMSTF